MVRYNEFILENLKKKALLKKFKYDFDDIHKELQVIINWDDELIDEIFDLVRDNCKKDDNIIVYFQTNSITGTSQTSTYIKKDSLKEKPNSNNGYLGIEEIKLIIGIENTILAITKREKYKTIYYHTYLQNIFNIKKIDTNFIELINKAKELFKNDLFLIDLSDTLNKVGIKIEIEEEHRQEEIYLELYNLLKKYNSK